MWVKPLFVLVDSRPRCLSISFISQPLTVLFPFYLTISILLAFGGLLTPNLERYQAQRTFLGNMSMKTALSRSLRSQHKLSGRGLSLSSNRGLAATSNASANLTSRKSEQTTYGQSSRSDLEPAFNTTTARFQTPAVDVGSYPLYRNAQPVPQKSTAQQTPFTDLLNAISYTLTTSKSPSLPLLHHLLRIYRSDPEHWSKYAHANPEKRYTRNLVFGIPGVFNLLLLVWTPGQKSLVHDHADAHCLMKVE